MLAGVDDRRPGDDVDRPERRAGARLHDPALHRPARRARASPAAPRSARTWSPSTRRSARDALVGPFCYLRPGTVLETRREGRRVRGDQELAHRRTARRCRTSRTSATRRSATGTNIGAGNITANFPHQPGKPKGRTTIGRNVRTGVHNAFVAPVEIGDDAWIGAGSVITEDVPPESLAVARARQENKEGYVRRKREREDELRRRCRASRRSSRCCR